MMTKKKTRRYPGCQSRMEAPDRLQCPLQAMMKRMKMKTVMKMKLTIVTMPRSRRFETIPLAWKVTNHPPTAMQPLWVLSEPSTSLIPAPERLCCWRTALACG